MSWRLLLCGETAQVGMSNDNATRSVILTVVLIFLTSEAHDHEPGDT